MTGYCVTEMLNCKKIGHNLICIIGLFVYCTHITEAEVKSVSACHGTTSTTCHYITLECDPGSRIRILSMKYGVKDTSCNNNERRSRCLDPSKNGCCVTSSDDCMEYYSDLHAYNLYKECSGEQSCGPLPVPNKILKSCDSRTSTYVLVTYECQSDDNDVRFCDNYSNVNGTQLSVTFRNIEDMFTSPTNCSCFIESDNTINIDYADIRMIKAHTSDQGSDCSSAELTTVPDTNDIDTQCDSSVNENRNFIYSELSQTNKKFIEVKLLNLYLTGNNDAPLLIWLNINAKDQSNVNVLCFKHEHQTTPLPPTTTTASNQPSNTTKAQNTATDDEGSNTGVIVAGILVPIILLAVIGAVVVFLVWRRRGYLFRKQKNASPNKYTDNADIENSVENSEYAEIGFVPDIPVTSPTYDPVYEPRNKRTVQELNGHTYQNVGNRDKDDGKQSKTPKGTLGKLKSHTDRLISFFRNQTENDFPEVKKRDRENSYDHLRPVSANSTVEVEVTPPNEEPLHMYSHTNDDSVKRQVAMNQDKDKNAKKVKASQKIDKHSLDPTEEINAFHVGDSYIEFQFGAVDESHPDLVKSLKGDNENARPAPPSRPPPSPKSATVFDKTHTPKSSPKQPRPGLNVQNDTQTKSPNFLSPEQTSPINGPNYDYAAGAHIRPRSVSPHGSDGSDASSEHSYKVLEKQQVYDYADVSDDELADKSGADTYGSIYEDVDKNPKSVSVRKHKSAMEIPLDTNGYLEPVTSRTRVISSPGLNSELEENKSAASLLTAELKEKTQQKKNTKSPKKDTSKSDKGPNSVGTSKQKGSEDSNTLKSDNVGTKDYQKVDGVKGVLKMAKLFDNKDSDSDSSRQSSPRNIQITKGNKKDLKKTSSDA